jgi:hypothetical protein
LAIALWVGQEQCALSEIIQDKTGQDDGEPAEADRLAAEMTHIGVHRLAAGDRQEGGAKHREADAQSRVEKEAYRAERAESDQDRECTKDPGDAEDADDGEPQQHCRSKNAADETRALALDQEQPNQDHDAGGHDHRCELRRIDFQSFHRAQYRNCRCDDTIAIQQRCPNQSDDEK